MLTARTYSDFCEAVDADPELSAWREENRIKQRGDRQMLRVWNLIEAPSDYDDVFDTQIPVPIIRVAAGEHPRVVDESEAALIAAGLPLYPRGNAIVRPIVEVVPAAGEGATIIWQDPVSSLLSRPD